MGDIDSAQDPSLTLRDVWGLFLAPVGSLSLEEGVGEGCVTW